MSVLPILADLDCPYVAELYGLVLFSILIVALALMFGATFLEPLPG